MAKQGCGWVECRVLGVPAASYRAYPTYFKCRLALTEINFSVKIHRLFRPGFSHCECSQRGILNSLFHTVELSLHFASFMEASEQSEVVPTTPAVTGWSSADVTSPRTENASPADGSATSEQRPAKRRREDRERTRVSRACDRCKR